MTDKQRSQIEIINKDDSKRIFYMLPKNAIERQMRKSNPDLSDEQLAEMVNFIAEERSKDPLCLTQDDVFDQRGEGQLITLNLSPNLELSLVIAQATGSIIITDNLYRWEELKGAQNRMSGVVTPLVPEMITKLTSVRFPAYHDPETTWHLRNAGRLGKLRSVLCSLNSITANQDQSAARERSAWLCAELDNALIQANAELQHPKNRCGQPIEDAHLHAHSLALEVLSPAGGLGNITSQRLLVSIGNIGHREFVPMAIFFRRC